MGSRFLVGLRPLAFRLVGSINKNSNALKEMHPSLPAAVSLPKMGPLQKPHQVVETLESTTPGTPHRY